MVPHARQPEMPLYAVVRFVVFRTRITAVIYIYTYKQRKSPGQLDIVERNAITGATFVISQYGCPFGLPYVGVYQQTNGHRISNHTPKGQTLAHPSRPSAYLPLSRTGAEVLIESDRFCVSPFKYSQSRRFLLETKGISRPYWKYGNKSRPKSGVFASGWFVWCVVLYNTGIQTPTNACA
ncbi:hypothetical protein FQR65_LT20714 [Abscondita terminalis]|nr:hypothetical protein FQR65_LT20714 [Abscondita terminalis]